MKIGIIGLPLSGKTSLFNALTSMQAETVPGSSGNEPHIAVVKVPDLRLARLEELYIPKQTTYATIEFVDASNIEHRKEDQKGFSPAFLGYLKSCDALVQVIRMFPGENVPHPLGSIDHKRDYENLNTEIIVSDLSIVETRIEKLKKALGKKKDAVEKKEFGILEKCAEYLNDERFVSELDLPPDEEKIIRSFQLLSNKPSLYVLNIGEDDIPDKEKISKQFADETGISEDSVLCVCAKIEDELNRLPKDERIDFMSFYEITDDAVSALINKAYSYIGLVSFLTAGEKEVRAWTIPKGINARKAASAIHSDIERGFIRAEVVPFFSLDEFESISACRDKGVLRLEGKEYIVKDGDVIEFRFNV